MFSSRFILTALIQSAGGPGQSPAHAVEQRRDARADVAHHRSGDPDVRVHLLRLDVDLDERLRRIAPGLALAVRQEPVEPSADQHHDVGLLQHRRACGARALPVRVGKKALGHAHRKERDAALFDQAANLLVDLRVGRPFPEDDQGTPGALEEIERTRDGVGRRNLRRCGIDDLDERLGSRVRVDRLREQFGRQIEIDAARATGHRGTDRARHADADVRGMQHAERRLTEGLGNRQLVHLFVVALLQIDDLALGRAADQDHRKAVGRRIGQRGQTVEEAGGRHGEADAGLLGQVAGDGRGVAGVLLMPERDDAYAGGLRQAAEVRDGDARHPVDGLDAIEHQRFDDEVKAVGQLPLGIGRRSRGRPRSLA